MDNLIEFDIGPLTWVKGEIDNAFVAAREVLAGWNGSDETPLKAAAAHLHQVYGALQIVDLQGVSLVCAEAERLLADMQTRPELRDAESVAVLDGVIQALQNYLQGLLDGAANTELTLAPQLAALQARRGVDPSPPSELFFPDTSVRVPRSEPEASLDDEARRRALHAARARLQKGLLRVLQNKDVASGLMDMADALREVEAMAPGPAQYTFWWSAGALIEALRTGGLEIDSWVKRLFGRIDMQLRRLMEGSNSLAERLLRDLFYYLAQADVAEGRAAEARERFGLAAWLPAAAAASGGADALRPRLAALREQVNTAKDLWMKVCGGREDAVETFRQATRLLAESCAALPNPALAQLARIQQSIAREFGTAAAVNQTEGLQLEMATALILIQNASECDWPLPDAFTTQAELQGQRLQAAIDPELDLAQLPSVPMLDEMARQAQEKLLLAQVSEEILANLKEVETLLDRFFRDSSQRESLPLVPGLMKQVLGALNMLELDAAAELTRAALARIEELIARPEAPAGEALNWIAEALSTLGLYIEALRLGRDDQAALRSLIAPVPTAEARETSVEDALRAQLAVIRREVEDWIAHPAEPDEEDAAKARLKSELAAIQRDADLVSDPAVRADVEALMRQLDQEAAERLAQAERAAAEKATAEAAAAAASMAAASAQEVDAELLQIYLEEAVEVLTGIREHLARLSANLGDRDAFADIRRGFHTLKGSGRMVGLTDPAEAAWEVEQTLNAWLADGRAVSSELLEFIERAAAAFAAWVAELEAQGRVVVEADALVQDARALRGKGVTPPPKADAGAPAPAAPATPAEADLLRFGEHRLPAALFQIFTEEARQHLDTLGRLAPELAVGREQDAFVRAAHTLAGIARTTGFTPLAEAAHALERWAQSLPAGRPLAAAADLSPVLEPLERILAEIQSGRFPKPAPALAEWLPTLSGEDAPFVPEDLASTPPAADMIEPADEIDPLLLPLFLAEADELLPRIGDALRQWRQTPADTTQRAALQRLLHTLKGSARMAGAMRLGERTHALEAEIIELGESLPEPAWFDRVDEASDRLAEMVEALAGRRTAVVPTAAGDAHAALPEPEAGAPRADAWRGRADVIDSLLNEAGEISIARARLDNVIFHARMTAQELTANVERLRNQLREMEIQAETRMRSQLTAQQQEDARFDPLEFDRFTRLQELTRLMAESVNDVSTAQDNLLAGLAEAEAALTQQQRMARALQQELMSLRLVPFANHADRLHRIVRQAARELGRKARLIFQGGEKEIDRGLLERIIAPLEHLLRNAVAHGIEAPGMRRAAGKPEEGRIELSVAHEGNEVVVRISDDGVGIDPVRVRQRAEALGWLGRDEPASDERLYGFLFQSGFSTADTVTQLAGRGVGLDVVRSEVAGVGGRVRLESQPGEGCRFTLRLPLTLALAAVVLTVAGDQTYALPASNVVLVKEVREEEWNAIAATGAVEFESARYPLRSLAELTMQAALAPEGKYRTVMLLASGGERLALRVDRLIGNYEAVVKNIGPQLARVVGVAGATVLGDGRVALILNPFALAERAAAAVPSAASASQEQGPSGEQKPLVLVVDDSLTVRKITGRLLHREGYRVATAKDGMEALEFLEDERPAVMLLDIEMPRMDGFETTRHVRANELTRDLPIIMITSRSADKHRQHALELGVDVYMGKPYQEAELLAEIARFAGRA